MTVVTKRHPKPLYTNDGIRKNGRKAFAELIEQAQAKNSGTATSDHQSSIKNHYCMLLQQSSLASLRTLDSLIAQLSEPEYAQPLKVLSGSSIGKHVRHLLEFYDCLFGGMAAGKINYDTRQRNLRLETDKEFARITIQTVREQIQAITDDVLLQLQVCTEPDNRMVSVPTTLYRELVYNIEHCTHHLALIRIAVETSFADVVLSEQFGVAYSTIHYKQTGSALEKSALTSNEK